MIAWLMGKLRSKNPESVVLDVGGVGYQVSMSLNSFCQLPGLGSEVEVDIFTYVREDQITLFGFKLPREKETFKLLISISGIGPRLALNILSGISPDELADAVSGGNLARLKAVPGVGKKTAERILIELKDKLHGVPGPASQETAVLPGAIAEDLNLALTTLGYKKSEIDKVLRHLPVAPGAKLEQLIKEALKLLKPRGA